MVVTVNAKIAFMFAKHPFSPIHIFFQANNFIFAMLAAIAPNKTGKCHPPIRVKLAEQPTVKRTIQNFTEQAIAPIGLDDTIAVSDINFFPLDFKLKIIVNVGTDIFFKEGTQSKVVISSKQVKFHPRFSKFSQDS